MDLQPQLATLALDVQATTCVDSYLGVVVACIVQVVVGNPEPVVLHVETCGELGNMNRHVSGNTLLHQICGRDLRVWSFLTLLGLKVGASKASNASMDVPHASRSCVVCTQIVLNQNRSLLLPLRADEHVGPLDRALLAGLRDLHYRLGIVDIVEILTGRDDDRCKSFAHDLRTRRDINSSRNLIEASINEQDLALALGLQ